MLRGLAEAGQIWLEAAESLVVEHAVVHCSASGALLRRKPETADGHSDDNWRGDSGGGELSFVASSAR